MSAPPRTLPPRSLSCGQRLTGQLRSADGPVGYSLVPWEVTGRLGSVRKRKRRPKEASIMREIEIKPVPVKREERRTSAFNKK
ncbi:hypothetical protein [Streptomyces pinistramenti]|uniref:hypothetical protein n=1 Tax=Streptomyces pinistramenti TaxID=2884812 RepID=UPI001D0633BA|nr:hypothetical protein [Streptomyces pinistramenti]MCB5911431.1 hypothetical protein [Streptomyces pinistramenti]